MQLRPKSLEVRAIENYCLPVISESVKIVGNTIEWANGQAICPDDLYDSSVWI